MKKKSVGQIVLTIIMVSIAVMCILPVILIFIATFTDEVALAHNGFSFFPEKWSLESWKYLANLKDQIFRSYGVTIFITVFGTVSTLLVESLFAYTLSRKNFVLKAFLSVMLLITMLFSGGQLSEYIVKTQMYGLRDKIIVLCLPGMGAMQVILMRSYIEQTISDSLIESARLDGAGEFYIYRKICLPLMPPTLASLGFMKAVTIWNSWEDAMLYISSKEKAPLQLILIQIQNKLSYLSSADLDVSAEATLAADVPELGARMAILFTVLGPIMIAYPFFQKYFVKGLTLGAVKG